MPVARELFFFVSLQVSTVLPRGQACATESRPNLRFRRAVACRPKAHARIVPAWAWLIINPADILLSSSHLLPPANMPVLQPPPSGAALRSRLADLRAMRNQGHRVSPRLEMGGDEAQGEAKELQG